MENHLEPVNFKLDTSFFRAGNQNYTQYGQVFTVYHSISKRRPVNNTITIPAQTIPARSVPVTGGGGGTVNIPAYIIPSYSVQGPEQSQFELFYPFFMVPYGASAGLDPFENGWLGDKPVTLVGGTMAVSPVGGALDSVIALDVRVHGPGVPVWPIPTNPGGYVIASTFATSAGHQNTARGLVLDDSPQVRTISRGDRLGVYPDFGFTPPGSIEFDSILISLQFLIN